MIVKSYSTFSNRRVGFLVSFRPSELLELAAQGETIAESDQERTFVGTDRAAALQAWEMCIELLRFQGKTGQADLLESAYNRSLG